MLYQQIIAYFCLASLFHATLQLTLLREIHETDKVDWNIENYSLVFFPHSNFFQPSLFDYLMLYESIVSNQ